VLFKLALRFLRPYRKWLAIVLVAQFLQTLATLYLPTLNADIIDNGVIKGNTGYIFSTGGIMLGVSAAQVVVAIIAVYFGAKSSMALGRDLRKALFNRVQDFSTREVGKFGTPSLITRTTNDVQQVQMLVLMTLTMMLTAPIIGVGAVILSLHQNVQLSGLLLVIVPVLGAIVTFLITRMRPMFKLMQSRIDTINQVLREQITGIRVIRAFVRDEPERERFERANDGVYQVAYGSGRLMGMMFPLVMSVINFSSIAVLWFGGHLINDGSMQVGALTAFLSYLMQVLMAVMMSTFMLMMIPRAEVCADRIQEVLDTEPSVEPPKAPVLNLIQHGHLELRDTGFRYPGAEEPVLCNINLVARPGEVTAIIGSTGAGKTTLLNLIPRLFDATEGEVLVGGVDVKELAPEALAKAIAIVPQKPYLFSGTIASNLRYGRPDATDEELWHALRIAQANFVTDLDAPISQGGTNVSGGQRQRLAIARALVRNAPILLLDEATSALDAESERLVQRALSDAMAGRTTLVIAHRLATVLSADRIVVMDEGRVVETGTHAELTARAGLYAKLAKLQFGLVAA
jgi:ATP-binding cassette subfamily B multidrug efflux pump